MNCHAAENLLSSRLDGRLSVTAGASLDAHLERCSACREQARRGQRLAELLRREPAVGPAPDLVARIMQRIPEDAPAPESMVDRWIRVAWPVALGAACAALALGLSSRATGVPAPRDPIAAVTADIDAEFDDLLALTRR
jgi:anti-sigma factor RsiW